MRGGGMRLLYSILRKIVYFSVKRRRPGHRGKIERKKRRGKGARVCRQENNRSEKTGERG